METRKVRIKIKVRKNKKARNARKKMNTCKRNKKGRHVRGKGTKACKARRHVRHVDA